MKFTNILKGSIVSVFAAATVLLPVSVQAITPGSVPYQDAETSGVNFPAFNIFNGVPSVGNEADFIRVKKDGEANSTLRNSVDTTCKTGDRFDVWFYLHNGAKPSLNDNGNGDGVAKNVVAKVNFPTTAQTSFAISGGVTASNAQAINDGATINCGGKQFKLKYVKDSADAFLDLPNKTVPLGESFVNGSGAAIGTNLLDGNVWGCWEQRVWMGLKVEVEEVPEIPQVKMPVCTALDTKLVGRKLTINKVQYTANDATVKNIRVDFGDGTKRDLKESDFPYTHTYAKDGSFDIRATVLTDKGDVTSDSCTAKITTTTNTVEKPKVLPNTGAGSLVGIFGLTTVAATLAHRYIFGRKYNV